MLSRQADTLIARRETIDQAVAELEFWYSDPGEYHVTRALAILRGGRT